MKHLNFKRGWRACAQRWRAYRKDGYQYWSVFYGEKCVGSASHEDLEFLLKKDLGLGRIFDYWFVHLRSFPTRWVARLYAYFVQKREHVEYTIVRPFRGSNHPKMWKKYANYDKTRLIQRTIEERNEL